MARRYSEGRTALVAVLAIIDLLAVASAIAAAVRVL